jgi:hypothetical protein
MDYDVIFVDEGRNAVTDHRTGGRPTAPTPWRPLPARVPGGSRTVVVPPGARPTVITGSASGYYQPAYYSPAYQPAYGPPMSSFASRFGMTTGELIDTGIQLLAAIQSLPAAPTAQGEAITDVENLMTYQGALAQHAKRDEQLRTLGNLLVRVLK